MMAQQALPVGLQCFHVEPFFPPFSPVQNRTGYFSASFSRLRRSALQPSSHLLAVKRSFSAVQKSFPFILD